MLQTLLTSAAAAATGAELSKVETIIQRLIDWGINAGERIIGAIIDHISAAIQTPGRLTLATAITCVGVNLIVGEHYLAIILPGQSFLKSFDKLGLKRKFLTRILNDAGAAVNAIIPWSVSGVFIAGALQVNPLRFIPWTFFPFLVTILAVITGMFLKIPKKTNTEVTPA